MVFSSTPDILALLREQVEVSREAIAALEDWSTSGDEADSQRVADLEHRADDARREVVRKLNEALTTPVDQEHLYVLSERCDRVVNAAKNLVHQAQALGWEPDQRAAAMASDVSTAMERLCHGLVCLGSDNAAAASAADEALKASRGVARTYRHALAEVLRDTDFRQVLATQEIYRRYADTADLVAATADRLWFAVLSLA